MNDISSVSIAKRFASGVVIGALLFFIFGAFGSSRAIAPGAIKAPVFSPSDNDVAIAFLNNLTLVNSGGSSCAADGYGPAYAKATCPAGYEIVGGGCSSSSGWPEISHQRNNSLVDLSAWECYMKPATDSGTTCHQRNIVAQAICAKTF